MIKVYSYIKSRLKQNNVHETKKDYTNCERKIKHETYHVINRQRQFQRKTNKMVLFIQKLHIELNLELSPEEFILPPYKRIFIDAL